MAAYYNSIRHDKMLRLLEQAGVGEEALSLVGEYLALPDTRGTGKGLTASGSLSPLLGAPTGPNPLPIQPLLDIMSLIGPKKGL